MFSYKKETDAAFRILHNGNPIATVVGDEDLTGDELENDAKDLVRHLNNPPATGPEYNCLNTTLTDTHPFGYFNTAQHDGDAGREVIEIVAPNGGRIAYVSNYREACAVCAELNSRLI